MGGLDFGQHGLQILWVFTHECFQLSAGHGGEVARAALSRPMAQPGQLHRLPAVKPMADGEAADAKNGRQAESNRHWLRRRSTALSLEV